MNRAGTKGVPLTILEDIIHRGLEGSWRVAETKVHHKGFKQSMVGAKGRFPFIPLLDAYVVEAPPHV